MDGGDGEGLRRDLNLDLAVEGFGEEGEGGGLLVWSR